MKTPEKKYYSDPHYRLLVDQMLHQIRKAKYTPSEMREAAIYASILYEYERIKPVVLPPGIRGALKRLEDWSRT